MAPVQPSPLPASDYHTWRQRSVSVAGRGYTVATKAGLPNHGRDDTASTLLAERVVVPPGATVVHFNCGSALFSAVAAVGRGADRVIASDRNAVAVEAARRTFAANGVANATVHAGHGSAPLDPTLRADVVAIRIPVDKLSLLQLLADAFGMLRVGGQCCIAGATNEGVKSAATLLERLFGNATVLGTDSGHRAVMSIKRAPTPSDTSAIADDFLRHDAFHAIDALLRGIPVQLFTRPGVFSWEHLDEATALLADVMQIHPGDDVLDLGCGSGPLAILAARLSETGRVTLVDADSEAVRCAARGVAAAGLSNCEVLRSDVASAVLDRRFDSVICNPPFHIGKQTDLDVPHQFIRDALQVLKSRGTLQLVANRTLPYERMVRDLFGNLEVLHDGRRFKVLAATKRS